MGGGDQGQGQPWGGATGSWCMSHWAVWQEKGMHLHAGPACPILPNHCKQVEARQGEKGHPRPARGVVQEEASVPMTT